MTQTTTKPTIEVPSPVDVQAALDDAQLLLYRDRRRAHATLFGGEHRKANKTPEFHWQIIDDFHSDIPKLCIIGFRGSAKTTLAEEGAVIRALFREFRYCMIVSSTSDIAEMRLHAIRRQFETNESILEIFGNLKTKIWGDEQIELSTGIVFRAVGRGQAIRGTKDEDVRPDFILCDDIEDLKSVANETQIKKTLSWFDGELVGSADKPHLKMRMLANDMGPDCLANKLKLPNSGWTVRVYPWIVSGASIWEDRYPLDSCLKTRAEMYERGSGDEYEREYMCSSERPEAKTFRDDLLKVDARVRVYEPVNAMIVPTPMQSGLQATPCAAAVWSWIGEKCVVWETWSRNLAANEIVAEATRIDEQYKPVRIGFEREAYDAWAHASLKLPAIVTPKAHREDLDFIRALQPLFVGKYLSFATEPREVWPQFTAFPNGPLIAPMALAFALHADMRGGVVMYENFSTQNIAPDIPVAPLSSALALNAKDNLVIGVLCQSDGTSLHVIADWIGKGDVTQSALSIIQRANWFAQRRCPVVIPRRHFERFKDQLPSSLRSSGVVATSGGDIGDGRRELHRLLREQTKGVPRLLVSQDARWTMNGFLEGYTINADTGPYALALEALESAATFISLGDTQNDFRANAVTRDGREYISARPVPRTMQHG